MWLYEWKPVMISHHPARFGGNWCSVNGDITYLMCQINSQDHVTLWVGDHHQLPKVGGHRPYLWVGAPHGKSSPCQVGGSRHFGSEDMFSVFIEQDSTCFLNSIIIFLWSIWHVMVTHTKFYNKVNVDGNLYMWLMKEVRSWPQASWVTKYGI